MTCRSPSPRLFIILLVGISIMWIPIIEQVQGGQLFVYIQVVAAYLAPPIAAIYCMAILWKRMNESGAFWGLMSGFLVGMVRMALDFYYSEPPCGEEDFRPAIVKKIHYMYFAMLLFWVTAIIAFIVTLITKPPEPWRLIRTTYFTRFDHNDRDDDLEMKERVQNELLQMAREESGESSSSIREIPWYRRIYNWLSGFDDSAKAQEEAAAMNLHIAELTNLHQEEWEKKLLNVMLIIIILVAVGFYIYFSINPFTAEEVHDIQMKRLKELGYDSILQ